MLPKGRPPKKLPGRSANLMTRISTFHPPSVAASEPSSQSLVLDADCGAENSSFNILSKYSLPPSCSGSSSSSSFPGGTASLGSCPTAPTQSSSVILPIAPLSRRDAPVIRHTKRGRIDLALDATLSGETKLQALKTLAGRVREELQGRTRIHLEFLPTPSRVLVW